MFQFLVSALEIYYFSPFIMQQPLLIIMLMFGGLTTALSQTPDADVQIRPSVYLLGTDEDQYADIIKDYPANLVSVSGDSMEKAYENWMLLLLDMEDHASQIDFNLKGIKIWINVFWNKEGRVDYITYYPKPNCRNIPFEELTAFFKSFINTYHNGIPSKANYSHYGSASFPSFAEKFLSKQN
jgi:hypothetical protein